MEEFEELFGLFTDGFVHNVYGGILENIVYFNSVWDILNFSRGKHLNNTSSGL